MLNNHTLFFFQADGNDDLRSASYIPTLYSLHFDLIPLLVLAVGFLSTPVIVCRVVLFWWLERRRVRDVGSAPGLLGNRRPELGVDLPIPILVRLWLLVALVVPLVAGFVAAATHACLLVVHLILQTWVGSFIAISVGFLILLEVGIPAAIRLVLLVIVVPSVISVMLSWLSLVIVVLVAWEMLLVA